MHKNNNSNYFKRSFVLILSMILITSFVGSVYAEEKASNSIISSDITGGIVEGLKAINDEKELFGLGNVDFEKISVGGQILAYEYKDDKLNTINVCFYPLTINEKLVAFAYTTNNQTYHITTQLVDEISSSINSNEPFALIYDNSTCYAYTESNLVTLHQFNKEYSNNRQKIDKISDVPNIKETKLNKFAPLKSSIYSTNINASTKIVSLAVNDYVSCPVSYVPQGNDNICWAASDACIGNYLKGLNRSAVYVAQCYFTPPADYNQGLSDGGLITTILNSVFNLSYTYHAWVTPSIYTSKSIISSGKTNFSIFAIWCSSSCWCNLRCKYYWKLLSYNGSYLWICIRRLGWFYISLFPTNHWKFLRFNSL